MGFKTPIVGIVTGIPVAGTTLDLTLSGDNGITSNTLSYLVNMLATIQAGGIDLNSVGGNPIQITNPTGVIQIGPGGVALVQVDGPGAGVVRISAPTAAYLAIEDLHSSPGIITPAAFSGTKTLDGVEVPYI